MRIYISGKISGLEPSEYREKFQTAEEHLRAQGHDVINPAIMDVYNLSWPEYMAVDGVLVGICDAIYMLDNWQDSNGAKMEKEQAEKLGRKIMYEREMLA